MELHFTISKKLVTSLITISLSLVASKLLFASRIFEELHSDFPMVRFRGAGFASVNVFQHPHDVFLSSEETF